jgi:hypothetical protein
LLDEDATKIDFARDYVHSLEQLVAFLRSRGESVAAVRKEVTDRASMSNGAARFLVGALDERSQAHQRLAHELAVSPATLRAEFLGGLAAPQSRECYRRVGKVHIADMLLDALGQHSALPRQGEVRSVIDGVLATIATGDKPKALALLNALEAWSELPARGLERDEGLGGQLVRRLCLAALAAPNTRSYHPARAIHDRVLRIVCAGVSAESELFPHAFVDRYLQGDAEAVSDTARADLERYVSILESLQKAEVELDEPHMHAAVLQLTRHVDDGTRRLADALTSLTKALEQSARLEAPQRSSASAQALGPPVR